jgi:hypothetical protein
MLNLVTGYSDIQLIPGLSLDSQAGEQDLDGLEYCAARVEENLQTRMIKILGTIS